jgi:hypothetical protein
VILVVSETLNFARKRESALTVSTPHFMPPSLACCGIRLGLLSRSGLPADVMGCIGHVVICRPAKPDRDPWIVTDGPRVDDVDDISGFKPKNAPITGHLIYFECLRDDAPYWPHAINRAEMAEPLAFAYNGDGRRVRIGPLPKIEGRRKRTNVTAPFI